MLKNAQKIQTDKLVNRLFYILVILNIALVFISKYFVSQDGPAHLYNACILKDLLLHNGQSVYLHFFAINPSPDPNWLGHLIIVFFLLFSPPVIAEKLFLVAYIVSFAFSYRFLIRQINPANSFMTLLIFPFILNITLYWGFYNFCISIVFYFLTVGYWLKYNGIFNVKSGIIFLLLVTLLYFSHPVSYFIAGLTLFFLYVGTVFRDFKAKSAVIALAVKRIVAVFIAFLPTALFTLLYFHNQNTGIKFSHPELIYYMTEALQNSPMNYLGVFDLRLWTIVSAVFTFILIYNMVFRIRERKWRRLDILFAVSGCLFLLCYYCPEEFAGGSVIFVRIALFSNLVVLTCLAIQPYKDSWKRFFSWFFFVIAIVFVSLRAYFFRVTSSGIDEYLSVEKYIPEGKTLMPLQVQNPSMMPDGIGRQEQFGIFISAANFIAVDRKLICLMNYEAGSGYFPVKWKNGMIPTSTLPYEGNGLTDSLLNSYAIKFGYWPDYILLWGDPVQMKKEDKLKHEVEIHYSLDHTSPNGYGWLYKKKL